MLIRIIMIKKYGTRKNVLLIFSSIKLQITFSFESFSISPFSYSLIFFFSYIFLSFCLFGVFHFLLSFVYEFSGSTFTESLSAQRNSPEHTWCKVRRDRGEEKIYLKCLSICILNIYYCALCRILYTAYTVK